MESEEICSSKYMLYILFIGNRFVKNSSFFLLFIIIILFPVN